MSLAKIKPIAITALIAIVVIILFDKFKDNLPDFLKPKYGPGH